MHLNKFYMDPFDDDAGSGGSSDDTDLDALLSDDAQEQGDLPNSDAAPAGFDADKFGAALATHLKPLIQQPAAPTQQKQLTDEEFRKLTGYYEVSKQDLIDLGMAPPEGEDEAKFLTPRQQAFQRMLDGMSTHSLKVVKHMMDLVTQQIESKYAPLLDAQRTQAVDGFVKRVAQSHEAFKGKEKLIGQAIQVLRSSGYKPQGDAADLKAVQRAAVELMKAAGADISVQTRQNGGGIPGRGNMPGAVNGAGGGGGGGTKKKNQVAELFG